MEKERWKSRKSTRIFFGFRIIKSQTFCRARAPGGVGFASVVAERGLSSCVHGLNCPAACGNLSKSGIQPVSPAVASGFITTEPLGKPRKNNLNERPLFGIIYKNATACEWLRS